MFAVGVSRADVTPPVGYLLQGHAKRNQPSRAIHDPLFLKALTVCDGHRRVALLTSDLVYFSKTLVEGIRAEAARRAGLPAERLMITAAHTHTGPFLFSSKPDDPRLLPDYLSLLQKQAVGALLEAIYREAPAVLRWGVGSVNIGIVNRRRRDAAGRMQMAPNPERPVDPQLTVLAACAPDGRPRAIVGNYTCHPTVLATDVYEISGDYPGYFQRALEAFYPSATVLFTNGCCGDVRPAIVDPASGEFRGGSFADAERLGRTLAGEAVKVVEQSAALDAGPVDGRLETVSLPLDPELLPTDAARLARACAAHQRSQTSHDGKALEAWRETWERRLKDGAPIPAAVPADVQALHLGNARIAGIAGETMVEIGLRIKAGAGRPLMLCGDANGVVGYLPTAAALPEGGYETNSFVHKPYAAPYSPAMEEVLVKAVLAALEPAPVSGPAPA